MIFDTNLIIRNIRQQQPLPGKVVIPMVVVGELEAFALKSDWGRPDRDIRRLLFSGLY